MPRRILTTLRWMEQHTHAHPGRLAVSSLAFFLMSLALLGFSLYVNLSSARSANATVCRNVNELRRDLYITAIDLKLDPVLAQRFLPTKNCETLP